METKRWLLQTDYYFQLIMLVGLITCTISVVGIIYAAFGLLPFGVWQVGSALTLSIVYGDKKRLYYLVIVAFYFLSWYLLSKYDLLNDIFFVFVVIALILGITYFVWTRNDYIESKNAVVKNSGNTDLLDAD
jgi:hypothetical protein